MDRTQLTDQKSIRALIAYLVVWGASTAYLAASGGDWIFPFASLIIFGLIFSGVIWFLTRKMNAPAVPVNRPARESLGLLAYLAIYVVLLIGIWLGTWQGRHREERSQEWAVLG